MDGKESVRVDYESAMAALKRVKNSVPGNPKVEVHLGPRLEDGSCDMTISGSAHASLANVAKNLELTVLDDTYEVVSMGRSIGAARPEEISSEPASKDPARKPAALKRAAARSRQKTA